MLTDNPIERAFELARSGTCRTVTDIRIKLKREGYSQLEAHFDSGSFKKQLRELINAQQ